MTDLVSAFLAIPVPTKYHVQLKKVQITVKKLLPLVDFSSVNTAHITLFYLGDTSAEHTDMITNIAQEGLSTLQGTTVRLQNLGHFGDPLPKHIYIEAQVSPIVFDYAQKLHTVLNEKNMFAKSLPLKPHVTIGSLGDESSQREYRFHKDYLGRLLAGLKLDFPITEVVLFAKLPNQTERGHQRIATWKV